MENAQDTLFIVDDNPVNLGVMKAVLEKEGFHIVTTKNSVGCIEIAKNLIPDLMLLDIDMPIMNGIEVCIALKSDPDTENIPIIFVTGLTDDKTLEEAFKSGGTDYVRKPINRVELLARIKSVLERQKLKKQLLEKEKLTGVIEMAGAICHELNQPLQVIRIYLDMIDSSLLENKELRENFDIVERQIMRMIDVTKKVMNISRYESQAYLGGSRIIDIDKASRD